MFLEKLNEKLWFFGFLPLFVLCAIRLLPLLWRSLQSRGDPAGAQRDGVLRPAQAAGTVLAATVGTGNIVGTAQAIAMGGPGAVFWMWAGALLGCSVKAGEIVFGQRFGGAMRYIRAALGRLPAAFYAKLALLSTLLVGNMAQVNASVLALDQTLSPPAAQGRLWLCLAVTALAAICLFGGVSSAGRICSIFVPVMTGLYVLGVISLLSAHRQAILPSLRLIVRSAFSGRAVLGAASGLGLRAALLWGLRRAAFSNEAGLGSAANIHAFSGTENPIRNARWGLVEVFVDTVLLCTLSALTVLCSGAAIPYGALPGPELVREAFASSWGERGAALFTALALAAFGFSTVLGCYAAGLRCAVWLGLGERSFRLLYLLCCFLGGLTPLHLIWRSADAVHVLMAVPNLLALLLLTGRKRLPGSET